MRERCLIVCLPVMLLMGCSQDMKVRYSPSFKDDPVRKEIDLDYRIRTGQAYLDDESNELTYMDFLDYFEEKQGLSFPWG